MGHSFCEFPVDIRGATPKYLQYFIAYAQMPLFFIVSGVLFSISIDWKALLRKKLPRLIIPYLAFSIWAMGLKMVFSAYTHSGAPSFGEAAIKLMTGGNYWFLYALFVMMYLCKLLGKSILIIFVVIVSIILNLAFDIQSSIINRICHYLPYFALGLLLKDSYNSWRNISKKQSFCIMVVGFALYLFALCPMLHCKDNMLLATYIIPLFGCIGYWGLAIIASKLPERKIKLITFFGKYSLQYYLNHIPIMLVCYYIIKFMTIQNAIMQWIVVFFLAVSISSFMLLIEIKIKPLGYLSGLYKRK